MNENNPINPPLSQPKEPEQAQEIDSMFTEALPSMAYLLKVESAGDSACITLNQARRLLAYRQQASKGAASK